MMLRYNNTGGLRIAKLLMQNQKSCLATHLRHVRPVGTLPSRLFHTRVNQRPFSTEQREMDDEPMDELELEAIAIQKAIEGAKENIEKNIHKGLGLSKNISTQVEEDKFQKMQRYDIFIAKME